MFCSLHVGVRRTGHQMETSTFLVVDEKQKQKEEKEQKEEEETIFQENLKSTNGHNQSHIIGFHCGNLTN